ncbi:MAG: SGNH/GDSL hydrolase family protein [Synergistaceae bacterium]|jgi:hypothetical protein|nr:SGNH/GDSL hydrolase family protein [Synergistaceae bacterium]
MNSQEALKALSQKNKDYAGHWSFLKESGISVADVFLEGGPNSIAIYEPGANPEEAILLLDELCQKNIEVKYIITKYYDDACISDIYGIEPLYIEELSPDMGLDFVVLLSDDDYTHKKIDIEGRTSAEVVSLWGMVDLILTLNTAHRILFQRIKKANAKMCSVAWPTPRDFRDPALYEMFEQRKDFSTEYLIDTQFFQDMYSDVPEYSQEYMAEVCKVLPAVTRENYIMFDDFRGAFMNIVDGLRTTVGQPEKCRYAIYIYGGCIAFTSGVDDRYTIASILQKYVNDYYGADRGYKVFNVAYVGIPGMDGTFSVKAVENERASKKIFLWFMRGSILFPKLVGGKFHGYLEGYLRKRGSDYVNPTDKLEEAAFRDNVYTDNTHVNHRGCRAFAKAVFTKYLKQVLDEDDLASRAEGSSEDECLSLAAKWEKLRAAGRSLGELFRACGCHSVAIRYSDMCEDEITSLTGELRENGVDVKYLISIESDGALYANPHNVSFVRIGDLPAAAPADMIIAMPGEEIFSAKSIFGKYTKTEVIRFADLVNLVYDRYFFYPNLSRSITRDGAGSCVIFWSKTDDLDISANHKAMPKSFPLDNAEANYTYYALQMNDVAGFSRDYLTDVFTERKTILPDGTISQNDVRSKRVNIVSGRRVTPGCPEKFDRSVFIFGDSVAFGMGADDGGAVSGALQSRLNSYSAAEAGRPSFRVINEGLCARSSTTDNILDKGIIPRFERCGIRAGDIALFFMWRRYQTTESDRRAYGYLAGYLEELGLGVVDLTETLALTQKAKNIYFDTRHVNHRGYNAVAFKVYFDYVKNKI